MNPNSRDRKIQAYWEDPASESMYDRFLAALETNMLTKYVWPGDRLLDLGCGDGTGSQPLRDTADSYVGLDRSSRFLRQFKDREPQTRLLQGDLKALPMVPAGKSHFSVILSQRALINLPDAESQRAVLESLPDLLEPGGKLLLCEAFREGLENLNTLRVSLGSKPIQERWHNVFLERTVTEEALRKKMVLQKEEDLSWYYILTRVFHQALVGDQVPEWDSAINHTAYRVALSADRPALFGYSTIVLQVWEKTAQGTGSE